MKPSRVLMAVGFAATVFLKTASADSGPWYLGAGLGATSYGVPGGSLTSTFPVKGGAYTTSSISSNSATAFRIDGGYRFNKYFALEGTYADFGSADSTFTFGPPAKTYTGRTEVRGEGLEAVARWPVADKLGLFGRAGLFRYQSDVSVGFVNVQRNPSGPFTVLSTGLVNSSTSGTTPVICAGVDYAFGGHLAVRAALDYFRAKTDASVTNSPTKVMPGVHLTSIEFIYGFD